MDRNLWVIPHSRKLGSIGYVLEGGWSHFFGRFLVYWEGLGDAYKASLSDIRECSEASSFWIEGFLNGQRPDPWFDSTFDFVDEDPRTTIFWSAVDMFRRTGVWR